MTGFKNEHWYSDTFYRNSIWKTSSQFACSTDGDGNLKEGLQQACSLLQNPHLTSSSDLMVLSFIIIWKRSKLLVPMGCSSNSLQRATSWGRSRCSSVSSSSNSFENRTMSFVVGCSPVPRTWQGSTSMAESSHRGKIHNHRFLS